MGREVPPEFTFRPATAEDAKFLYALNEAAMKEYVVKTWGAWEESFQREWFRNHFEPEITQIILLEGQPAGVLSLVEKEDRLELRNIQVHPDHQRRGIGTTILQSILGRGKPVELQVVKVNSARQLYERLGFRATGETETHTLMRRD